MGNSPRDCGPGGQWLGFIFIWWGIVLMGSCPRTDYVIITCQPNNANLCLDCDVESSRGPGAVDVREALLGHDTILVDQVD